jgi:hypothetical protein
MPKTTVTAIFDDTALAARAIDGLIAQGIDRQSVSVVLADAVAGEGPDPDLSKDLVERGEVRAERGARLGALVGASGMAIGAAALAIPGILVAGPLAVLLAAGAGAVSGSALGALVGIGVSRDVAEVYHRSLEGGAVMVGVDVPDERGAEIEALLAQSGGRSVLRVDYAE